MPQSETTFDRVSDRAAHLRVKVRAEDDQQLIQNGYGPIALNGKIPVAGVWQKGPITRERIAAMHEAFPHATNTGLRTGRLCVVDIDVRDPAHVQQIIALADHILGDSLLHRFGSKGMVICYRIESPIRKVTVLTDPAVPGEFADKVEVLGQGFQVAAFGIHPTTKQPFEWKRENFEGTPHTPLNTPIDLLPEVTEEKIIEFAKQCAGALGKWGYKNPRIHQPHKPDKKTRDANIEEDSPANVSRAKEHLKNCVDQGKVAVLGRFGNDTIYELACLLMDRFYLSPQTTETLMLEIWYPHCVPNNLESEACEIIAHAAKYLQNEPGANASRSVCETFKEALKGVPEAENDIAEGVWPKPFDLFADDDYERDARLTRDMLPDAIGDFAFDTAERFGVAPALVAIPCLTVAAAALHDNHKIQPQKNDTEWVESPRLWCVAVAEPGGKKTPALNAATAVLNDIERRWFKEDEIQLAKFEQAKDSYEAQRKARQKLESTTVIIDENPTEETVLLPPEKPIKRRIIVEDFTMEKLGAILEGNDRGVLAREDELSGWIGSFDAYRNKAGKDRAAALALWNGGPRNIDRQNEDHSYHVPNWSSSVIGGIQPNMLMKIVKDLKEDGLLQRFQPFFGETIALPQDRSPNYAAKARYEDAIKRLVDLPVPKPFAKVTLSPEARQYWDDLIKLTYYTTQATEQLPHLRSHAAKWPSMFARLLLTFHALDCVDAKQNHLAPTISRETAARADGLMNSFFKPQSIQFYETFFSESHETKGHAQWIAKYILSRGLSEITKREIKKAYRALKYEDAELVKVMDALYRVGWVGQRIEAAGGRGELSMRWPVNPQVHTLFPAIAASERKRREEIREGIKEATRQKS